MKKRIYLSIVIGCLLILQTGLDAPVFSYEPLKISVVSEKTVTGFVHPESVAFDQKAGILYVGQFGSVLKPTLKDGMGKISKVSLSGQILEENFLPAQGDVLNKPKGIWVNGNRLWVTDIDVVWVFDLESRKGRKAGLPGARFANDPTVINNCLFVSDTAGNQIYRITPADFLEFENEPTVDIPFSGLDFSPNGLCPGIEGSLIAVGYDMAGRDQGIYTAGPNGKIETRAEKLGRLDGVLRLDDGTLLITDWKSKSLLRWRPDMGIKILAKGFGGPADFCIVPEDHEFTVVVPDLVKSELRMIRFQKE